MLENLTLGRSGLHVTNLCLGAMTFGDSQETWTCNEETAELLVRAYFDAGGSFIDTANAYHAGESESIVGRILKRLGAREQTVLATKFTFGSGATGINATGNGRKNAYRALDESLRRLDTDYVDLYWMHSWDTVTPVEEVVQTFDSLVRAGKIRYYVLSDVPVWYAVRACDFAEQHGFARPIALQLEYSLLERVIDREHVPAAQELGLGLCPWSPLAGGALTGKYSRGAAASSGRHSQAYGAGKGILTKERIWPVINELVEVAQALGRTPAQVALNWAATQYRSTSVIVGVTREEQLRENLGAFDFVIPEEARGRLNEISRLESTSFYAFFRPSRVERMIGRVRGW